MEPKSSGTRMTVAAPDFLPMIPRDATLIPAALKNSLRFIVHLPSSVNRHRRSHREYGLRQPDCRESSEGRDRSRCSRPKAPSSRSGRLVGLTLPAHLRRRASAQVVANRTCDEMPALSQVSDEPPLSV